MKDIQTNLEDEHYSIEEGIYRDYQEKITPLIIELEVRDGEFPAEILNEIRSIFTHIARYRLQNSSEDISAANSHVKRAVFDGFKYSCISIAEKVAKFRDYYKKVDLSIANDGHFLSELEYLEKQAKGAFIEAKTREIKKLVNDTEQIYSMYEKAYNLFIKLETFLDDSKESIHFAESRSKRITHLDVISWIFGVIGVIGIIFTIISMLL